MDWTVLLIGGAGGSGKTTAAKEIARLTGAAALPTDDVWLALQRAIPERDAPVLHAFARRDVWSRATTELVGTMSELATLISSTLEPVVGTHLQHYDRVVIEGVWITPEFMRRTDFAGSQAGERCRSVIVFEDDPGRIRQNFFDRGRGFDDWSSEDQVAMAALQSGYARWLKGEAEERGVPVIASQPLTHLAGRILAVV